MGVILRLLPTTEVNKCLLIDWKSLINNKEEMLPPLNTGAQQTALTCIMPFNSIVTYLVSTYYMTATLLGTVNLEISKIDWVLLSSSLTFSGSPGNELTKNK